MEEQGRLKLFNLHKIGKYGKGIGETSRNYQQNWDVYKLVSIDTESTLNTLLVLITPAF